MADRITSPFGAFTPAREVVAGHDLAGKWAIVTGSATGIGVETVRALAEAGAEVTLAVRNLEAGQKIADEVNTMAKGKAKVAKLDLSDLASVRGFVDSWGGQPVHILVNNAGVMACPQTYTTDGLEMQIGTNHFGHAALTLGLAPALEKAAVAGRAARVVQLSSTGHRRSNINWDDINYRTRAYDKWEAYGQSKTANALFAAGFNARFKDRGVTANAVMPGGIMTPLQRHMPREEMITMGWIDEAGNVAQGFKTTEQGASTSAWAAVGPELEGVGGLYLEDCAQALPASPENRYGGVEAWALDPEAADRLWAITRETVGAG
ncbi:MAG TPA: oxidoreductase [Caulobacteraceae bacterium]|jgi:NAD(P)-dependent dehydrogenase (short-subunit alcohol dehydrogenase family)